MKRSCALLILTLLLVSVALPQKRAFKLPDLYTLKTVSDPQFSPDGKHVAFTVSESFLERGKTNSEIYVMDSDGKNLRRLTDHPSADNHPRWADDSRSINFVSSRSNGSQVWNLPLDAKEPMQVTNLSYGAGDPIVSADGKLIVFSADVFPDCGASDSCNAFNDSTKSTGPIQAYMADELLYRHWTFWRDGKRTHTLTFNVDTKSTTDLTPGKFNSPSFSTSGGGFDLSPDGKEVCFVSNHDRVEASSTNKDLWLVPSAGGEAVNITEANEAFDGDPSYSPDGRYIAYIIQVTPEYESDKLRLAVYDREKRESVILTDEFDNWVAGFQWAGDSKSIYFTATVQGHVPLYKVDVSTKTITPVADLKTIDGFTLSPDGRSIVCARRSVGEPLDLWKISSDGKNPVRLTFFNKAVEDSVDIRPAEEMWIPSPSGKKIHTFIVKPHNFDPKKRYPLIINVHGGPQSQWADAFRGDWQMYPGSGYIVAMPNPHGSTGYGQDFTAAISQDWAGKVYDDIMAVADSLEKIAWVDKDRMGAMGWSYGGFMMMWMEGHTTRFKAIASMMGVYNLTAMHGSTEELWFPHWDLGGHPWDSELYKKWSPNNFVKEFKTPCLVITGERDYRVSYTQSLEFFTDLQEMDVPSRLIVFPNDGHWPSGVKSMPLYYNAHLDWFHKYLGGDPAPYDMEKMLRNQLVRR